MFIMGEHDELRHDWDLTGTWEAHIRGSAARERWAGEISDVRWALAAPAECTHMTPECNVTRQRGLNEAPKMTDTRDGERGTRGKRWVARTVCVVEVQIC